MANPVEEQILAQEERLTSATQQLDLEALDRIYADDIMFTGVTGATCTKANLMDEARRGLAEREAAADTRHFVASYDEVRPPGGGAWRHRSDQLAFRHHD